MVCSGRDRLVRRPREDHLVCWRVQAEDHGLCWVVDHENAVGLLAAARRGVRPSLEGAPTIFLSAAPNCT